MELLERQIALDALEAALASARRGVGRVVVVEGPPGIGKSAVLDRFLETVDVRIVAGRCDELSIPRPLGPFVDAAARGQLDPDDVTTAPVLARTLLVMVADAPAVIAIDDAQWADAATADTVALLGRRIRELSCLLVLATRRDASSPIRNALARISADDVDHIALEPLSRDAVAQLVPADLDLDPDEVHEATGGLPYLTVERMRSPGAVSGTLRDRAAASLSTMTPDARHLAELLAVSPETIAWQVIERRFDGWRDVVDELESAHLVETSDLGVRYQHDLMRQAVEACLTGATRRSCHVELLDLLVTVEADPAVTAHHAEIVGDIDLLISSSVEAARRTAAAGAHVEALRHIERVLPHTGRLDEIDRGHLFEIAMVEYQLNMRLDDALAMADRRAALGHVRSDPTALSAAYRAISRIEWALGDADGSRRHLDRALAVLDDEISSAEMALRYVDVATDLAMNSRWSEAAAWVERAIELADEQVDARSFAQAHGAAELILSVVGDPSTARRHGDRAIAIFRRDGIARDLSITFGNRIANSLNTLRLHDYQGAVADAMGVVRHDDAAATGGWFAGLRARYSLLTGNWNEADRLVETALRLNPYGLHRAGPLVTRALLRARRGDIEAATIDLAEARSLLDGLSDIQRIGSAAAAEAEISWLGGELDERFFDGARSLAGTSGHRRFRAELAVWQRRLGRPSDDVLPDGPPPLVHELEGRWSRAATAWEELGCPYERALALAFSGDLDAMQEAAQVCRTLGAERSADRIRQLLRAAGVTVARGPRAATRANPAGLTNRQLDVANLLVDGLTNADIAERLFVSVKTVDHHVSAILTKLGVASRREAAARLGEMAADP